MPAISMFYGLIIYLYYYDNKKHHLPHIHVEYQGKEMEQSSTQAAAPDATLRHSLKPVTTSMPWTRQKQWSVTAEQ